MCEPYNTPEKIEVHTNPRTNWGESTFVRAVDPLQCLHTLINVKNCVAICEHCGTEIKDIEAHLRYHNHIK